MSIADYAELAILDALFNAGSLSVATPYLALHTSDPGEDGTTDEVSGGSYVRQAVSFGAAAAGAVSNDAQITYPTASGDWGVISHASLWDAESGGNCLWSGELTASKNIVTGVVFIMETGDLDVSIE